MKEFLEGIIWWTWRRPLWRILCYHDVPRAHARNFEAQLRLLGEHFSFVSLSEGLSRMWKGKISCPILTVTFDDAPRSVWDVAAPVLERLGVRACLYAVVDYIEEGKTYRDENPLPVMKWEELLSWLDSGHEVGSHTMTHAAISRCTFERMNWEMVESKRILEENLGRKVRHFSYPWGQFDSRSRMHNFWTNCYESLATIHRGSMRNRQDRFRLKRDVVCPDWHPERLCRLLWAADWLYPLRHLRRKPEGYWMRRRDISWNMDEVGELVRKYAHETQRSPRGIQ